MRRFINYPSDVGNEAHIQHPVRFIYNQNFDVSKVNVLSVDKIYKSTWRSDQYVYGF